MVLYHYFHAGTKFRYTSTCRAISDTDYLRLEHSCAQESAGPSGTYTHSPIIHALSDSDSDETSTTLRSLTECRNKRVTYMSSNSDSDSDTLLAPRSPEKHSSSLDSVVSTKATEIAQSILQSAFFCIICCQITDFNREPVIPPCCSVGVFCKACITKWLETSASCPYCRQDLQLAQCQPQPVLRPLLDILKK